MITSQPNAPADPRATAGLPSDGWLTAVLRPAGTLDGASADAFGRLLSDLSATADMVVVDLDATSIPDSAAFVETLGPAAACLAGPGRCLLLANAPLALELAVSAAGVPAATLAVDAVIGVPTAATGPADRFLGGLGVPRFREAAGGRPEVSGPGAGQADSAGHRCILGSCVGSAYMCGQR